MGRAHKMNALSEVARGSKRSVGLTSMWPGRSGTLCARRQPCQTWVSYLLLDLGFLSRFFLIYIYIHVLYFSPMKNGFIPKTNFIVDTGRRLLNQHQSVPVATLSWLYHRAIWSTVGLVRRAMMINWTEFSIAFLLYEWQSIPVHLIVLLLVKKSSYLCACAGIIAAHAPTTHSHVSRINQTVQGFNSLLIIQTGLLSRQQPLTSSVAWNTTPKLVTNSPMSPRSRCQGALTHHQTIQRQASGWAWMPPHA